MSKTFVKVTARGIVAREPELRALPDGKAVTTVNLQIAKPTGDLLIQDWEVFEEDAKRCVANLRVGSLVEFSGTEVRKQWMDRNTQEPRARVIKRAREVVFFPDEPLAAVY